MVTKPTGRPRGRPRKEPPAAAPKRKKGRPDVALRDDPERYTVALIEAHKLVYGETVSFRTAAKVFAAIEIGNEVGVPQEIAAACPAGMVAQGWGPVGADRSDGSVNNTRVGARASSIESRAAALLNKARDWRGDPERQVWLHCMSTAFAFALKAQMPIRRAAYGAFLAAQRVGEGQVAIDVILPMAAMFRGHEIPAPDFSGIFGSTTDETQ